MSGPARSARAEQPARPARRRRSAGRAPRSWSAAAPPTVCPSGVSRDDGPDPALEAQAGHPGARADRTLGRRRRSSPRDASAASWAARTSSAVTCIRRQSLRKESSHSPTTGMTTSSATVGVGLASASSQAAS